MELHDGVTLLESINITIFSIAIVFATLALVAGILKIFEKVSTKEDKVKPETETSQQVKEVASTDTQSQTSDEEIVAAIVMAIAEQEGSSPSDFIVRNIRRVEQNASNWQTTGRIENITKF